MEFLNASLERAEETSETQEFANEKGVTWKVPFWFQQLYPLVASHAT